MLVLLAAEEEEASWLERLVIFWTLTERCVVATFEVVVVDAEVGCESESVLDIPCCGLLMDAMTKKRERPLEVMRLEKSVSWT